MNIGETQRIVTSFSALSCLSPVRVDCLRKIMGIIGLFPRIAWLAKIVGKITQRYFHSQQGLSSNSDQLDYYMLNNNYSLGHPTFNNIPSHQWNQQMDMTSSVSNSSQRVVLVANKTLFKQHWTGARHPEAPQRVEAIENALREAHLMDQHNTILPRLATSLEISLCHSNAYQKELKKQIEALQCKDKSYAPFDNQACQTAHVPGDFQISPDTLNVALYAAGAPLTAIEYILNKENQTSRAFCIVRPPGHHAHYQTGSGFCVFNNVAIAAKHLTQNLGFKRVLIVDWDAHHGDGTQDLIEDDEKIFYFSTHRDTKDGFYPGSHWGKKEQHGVKRNVLNCPVSGSQEKCREGILSAFESQLIPAMDKYKPDFVLISCGFDAHEHDSLVGLGLTDEDYREMTRICVGIAEKYAQGRIVSVLEGGYNLEAIAGAAKVHVEALQHSSSGSNS